MDMYPSSLEKQLKKKGISVGDRVRIIHGKDSWEGILMPRTQDKEIWVLKLSSGYNIGINAKGTTIELLEKTPKPKPVQSKEKHKGEVAVLGCGGTIASKVEYKTGAVYPAITPEELRASFPQLEQITTIHTKQLFSIPSEDMNAWHWTAMARACVEEIKEGVKGIVLMHGTDTMTYSSAALSFMLQDLSVPVVFVGSQRSSDRPSSDNEINLLNSLFAAKQDIAEVAVCMHSSTNDNFSYLHRGTKVRKMHTSRRDAFQSINTLPLAKIDYRTKSFEALNEFKPRSKRKLKVNTKMNENIAMVYVYPGIQPKFLKHLSKYDGVVLVATGLGHIPTNPFEDKHVHSLLPEIKNLISSHVPVVLAPQTLYGRLNLNVYSAGRLLKAAGVIGDGCDWLPETAYCKLAWVLGQTKNMKKVKDLMETNLVGEISSRSPLEGQQSKSFNQ